MTDIFEGDPRLYLGADGSALGFRFGQPIMEQGGANVVLLSLFTRRGWCGNILARDPAEEIGSGFEESTQQPLNLTTLSRIRNAATRALLEAGFTRVEITVENPESYRVRVSGVIYDPLGAKATFDIDFPSISMSSEFNYVWTGSGSFTFSA